MSADSLGGQYSLSFQTVLSEQALIIDPERHDRPETVTTLTVDLPGLHLVNPDSGTSPGQIIYLDFDGEEDVTYKGPVTVGPFDVPAFSLEGTALAGQEGAISAGVVARVRQTFASSGVTFTTEQPQEGTSYSTIWIGGDDSAFSAYGSFLGLAEGVDEGNATLTDNAFVFSAGILAARDGADDLTDQLARTIAHEAGHLLGYEHDRPSTGLSPPSVLSEVAAPEITVLGNNVPIADGDTTPYLMDQTEWFGLFVGDTPNSHTFKVRNDGDAALTLGTVSVPTGFTLTEGLSASLGAGAFDTFTVRLDTVTAGVKTGDISFVNNDSDENPYNFRVTGTISERSLPEIGVFGEQIPIGDGDTTPNTADGTDFGRVMLGGTPVSHTFAVANNGGSGSILTLESVSVPEGFTVTKGLPASLGQGGSDVFVIRLDTTTAGVFSGDVSFSNNDSDENPYSFRITGEVSATGWAEVSVCGNTIYPISDGDTTPDTTDDTDFGSVAQHGSPVSHTFTVVNDGTATLTLGPVTVPTGFSVAEPLASSLAAGASDTFTVRLDADVQGTKAGDISFPTNDSDENPFNFRITGYVGGAAEITVLGNGESITDGALWPSTITGTIFNPVVQGGTPSTRTYTVRNDGTDPLTLGSIVVPTGFTLAEGLPASLAPGASDTFTVQLETAVVGDKSGQVSFANNDADENPFNFPISGTVQAPAPEVTILWQGYTIPNWASATDGFGTNFGTGIQGRTPIRHTFGVRNDGTALLTFGVFTVPTGFTVTKGLPASLAPGASDTFTIQLDTVTLGTKGGYVSIANNDSHENPFTFEVAGVVIADIGAEITVLGKGIEIVNGDTTPSLADGTDIGQSVVGDGGVQAQQVFIVRNDGTSVLTLGPVILPAGFSVADPLPASLAPGQSDILNINLDNLVRGTKTGDLSIATNDSDENPFHFRITGIVWEADVTVFGNGIVIENGDTTPGATDGTDFGSAILGALPISRTFTVRSDGNAYLGPLSLTIPAGFTLPEGLSANLAPGVLDTFTVQLDTALAGSKNGNIIITSNDPDENPFRFAIAGTVLSEQPEIVVLGNGVPISNNDGTPSTTDGTDFGTGLQGQPFVSRTFTVRNDGSAALTLGAVAVPAGFTLAEGLSTSLASGASDTFTVQLDSQTIGTQTGYISIGNDDGDGGDGIENPFRFKITGTIIENVGPEITVLGNALSIVDGDTTPSAADHTDFGTLVLGGASLSFTFGVRNDGTAPLTLGNVAVPAGFTLLQDQPASVAPGAWGYFMIELDTATEGTKTGDVSFTNNDAEGGDGVENPFNFRITGTVAGAGSTQVGVAVTPATVLEDGTTNLVYTFTRSVVASNPLTVHFSVGGTATFATDYTLSGTSGFDGTSGTVVIGESHATASVTVNPTADTLVEPDETVIVTVTSDTAYAVGTPATATGTIQNDDAAGNLASGKTAVASTIQNASFPAANATDGNLDSRWSSQFSDDEWLYVDLGSIYTINRVVLRWEASYGSGYRLQVSNDASTWSEVYSTTAGDGGVDDITLASLASGRYVRMLGTQRATVYGYSLYEMEVYGTGAMNHAPTVSSFSKTLMQDTTLTLAVADFAAAFTDPDAGDSLQAIHLWMSPGQGVLRLNDTLITTAIDIPVDQIGDLTYTPNSGYAGSDIFGWNGSDGSLYGDGAYVNLTIQAAAANLALGKTAVASTIQNASFPAADATDGNINSRWGSQYSDNEWLYVDLGAVYTIERVVMLWTVAYARGFKLQVSNDAATWMEVYSTTAGAGGTEDLTLASPASGRYVRFLGLQRATQWGYSFYEFEVYGGLAVNHAPTVSNVNKSGPQDLPLALAAGDFAGAFSDPDGNSLQQVKILSLPAHGILTLGSTAVTVNQEVPVAQINTLIYTPTSGYTGSDSFQWNGSDGSLYAVSGAAMNLTITAAAANLALGKTAVASTIQNASFPASYATDGDIDSRWGSQYSDNEWFYVDLGSVYTINRVVMLWTVAYARSFKLQVSNDATTWTDVYSTTAGVGGTEDITLASPASGRYVRFLGLQRATQWGYSFYEFEVYGGPAGPEITVLGNGVSISDGAAAPSAADGTDFGSPVEASDPVSHTFAVRNDGSSTLTLGAVTVPAGYTLTEGLPTSLAAGTSDTFTVQLNTGAVGTKAGDISFSTNDNDEDPFNFRITGTVSAYQPAEVTLLGNGVLIENGDTTPSTADGTDFGTVAYGAVPISHVFTVRNDGGSYLLFGTMDVFGLFDVTEPLTPGLAPGASDTFT
ncbi:MAG: choice-of-anchor D domain-containing protein, partial [Planctomycetes bacterium]|nr:choice-of-anchor D domain-containing protein [Planctomycetota bacterium]